MFILKKQQKVAKPLIKMEKRGHQDIILPYNISCVNKVLWFIKFSDYIHHNEDHRNCLYLLSACYTPDTTANANSFNLYNSPVRWVLLSA